MTTGFWAFFCIGDMVDLNFHPIPPNLAIFHLFFTLFLIFATRSSSSAHYVRVAVSML